MSTETEQVAGVAVRRAEDIEELAWQPVVGCPGVSEKEMWTAGGSVDALLRYRPWASSPGVAHPAADHHIWVVSGEATIAGRRVATGSYVHVPVGAAHPIHAGPAGCLLLQVHRAR